MTNELLIVVFVMGLICCLFPYVLAILFLLGCGYAYFLLGLWLEPTQEKKEKKNSKKKSDSEGTPAWKQACFALARLVFLFILLFGGVPLLTTVFGGVFPGKLIDDREPFERIRNETDPVVTAAVNAPFLEWKMAGLSVALPFGLFLRPIARLDPTDEAFIRLRIESQRLSYVQLHSCPVHMTVVHIAMLSCFIMEPFCIPSYDLLVIPPCAMENLNQTRELSLKQGNCPWEDVIYMRNETRLDVLLETCSPSDRGSKDVPPVEWASYYWPEKIGLLWNRTKQSVRCARPSWNILHRAAHVGNAESVRQIRKLPLDELRSLWYRDERGWSPIEVARSYKTKASRPDSFDETISLLTALRSDLGTIYLGR